VGGGKRVKNATYKNIKIKTKGIRQQGKEKTRKAQKR